MQRREAIQLLCEVASYPEAAPSFTCIYLKPRSKSGPGLKDYELHVKIDNDKLTLKIMERLASVHGFLTEEESGGFLVISSPERLLEIAV